MTSLFTGYEYDIFISYRQKDNKHGGWVTEFARNLNGELESTFKEDISIYFDENPQDGLLETHDVDATVKEKLKCLVFIPVISQTYCDPKSFAWKYEFKAFIEQALNDRFGMKVTLPNGNVASRVLPVRIHDLDTSDIKLCESMLGGVLRGVDFIYREPGVNRPLTPEDDEKKNIWGTKYRNQINKVANAIKEIITGLKSGPAIFSLKENDTTGENLEKTRKEKINSSHCSDPEKTQIGLHPDYNPNYGYPDNIETVFDSGKTMDISKLNQELGGLKEFKFRLIKEDDNSEIEIQSPDEQEVILNRSHLDAGNPTISIDQHVKIKYINQKFYMEDVSSNSSSYIQAKNKVFIQNNTKLVIGNKKYLFNTPENLLTGEYPGKTKKLAEFCSDGKQTGPGFILTDVANGKIMNFNADNVILNRAILDPGNKSISNSRHAELEFNRGKWNIKDYSSNESTFIQLKGDHLLENNIRIVLGNKIFRFECV